MARLNRKKAQKVRDDIQRWDTYWKYNINIYHEMTQFILGEQWKEDEAKLFETYKKIPLTVNKIAPLANHLLGEQKQNTPSLQILPNEDVTVEEAEVREALVKEISLNSDAKVVYQTAFQQASIGGYGAIILGTEYDNDYNFDQNIRAYSLKDPTKAYWSIDAETVCKTDGLCGGFKTTMSRKKFRHLYGKDLEKKIGIVTTDITDTDMIGMSFSDENSITVIDDYRRKSTMVTLYGLSNGKSVDDKEFNLLRKETIEDREIVFYDNDPVTIVNERTFPKHSIKHTKWAGDYELESTDFPSEEIPIIFVDQNSYFDKSGKQVIRPFFKDARDSQRYVNYLRTQMAYLIKISRYDQYLASKENVKSNDTAAIWRDPAIVQGALLYDESPSGNKPEQQRAPELSQSLLLQYQEAANDIQVTCGMFDTQIGQQGNEISGSAIDSRTERGRVGTYVPFNALNISITTAGRIIDQMIPFVYDTERTMFLDLKNSGPRQITLNQRMDEYGSQVSNDMSKGKYKIRLVAGPGLENQRRQDQQSMDMVFSKNPQTFGLIADLYAESLPMTNNIEMRNRLRTIVPPEIIEAGKTGQPLPPKPPQQDPMIALKQQELQMKMMQAQMAAQQEQAKLQLEEQKLMIQQHQAGTDFSKELAKLQLQREQTNAELRETELRYEAEMKHITATLHQNHSQNVVKILTHQPNHLNPSKTQGAPLND